MNYLTTILLYVCFILLSIQYMSCNPLPRDSLNTNLPDINDGILLARIWTQPYTYSEPDEANTAANEDSGLSASLDSFPWTNNEFDQENQSEFSTPVRRANFWKRANFWRKRANFW